MGLKNQARTWASILEGFWMPGVWHTLNSKCKGHKGRRGAGGINLSLW